jgi:hypothetical protein
MSRPAGRSRDPDLPDKRLVETTTLAKCCKRFGYDHSANAQSWVLAVAAEVNLLC